MLPTYSLLKQTLKIQHTKMRRKKWGGMSTDYFVSQVSFECPSCASMSLKWKYTQTYTKL